MQFERKILQKAADAGAKKVTEAFSKLSGVEVKAEVSKVEAMALNEALEYLRPREVQAVVVFSQLITGEPIHGASLLTMSRESALALVDILNQQEIGTTGILKDIDRSALKETLNILSNAYLTALAEISGVELKLSAPMMITSTRLEDIIDIAMETKEKGKSWAVLFETVMSFMRYKVQTRLVLLFDEGIYKAMVEK